MSSVENLKNHINRMKRQGDWQPMRDAVRIIVHPPEMTVAAFAELSEPEMVERIKTYVADTERGQAGNIGTAGHIPTAMLEP